MITIDENADVDKLQGIVKKYNYVFRSSSTYPSRNNLAVDLIWLVILRRKNLKQIAGVL